MLLTEYLTKTQQQFHSFPVSSPKLRDDSPAGGGGTGVVFSFQVSRRDGGRDRAPLL